MSKSVLENWGWYDDRIIGNIYNDERFVDGECVRTSRVIRILDNILETENSLYILGKKAEKIND